MIPGSANPLLLADAGYQIQRSLRFRSSASAYLARTPAVAGNRTTWTWSGWVKRGLLGGNSGGNAQYLFSAVTDNNNYGGVFFDPDGTLYVRDVTGGSVAWVVRPTQVFRDPSSWYHLVVSVNTTQTTAANRVVIYANGVQVTALSSASYPAQNATTYWNNNIVSAVGNFANNSNSTWFDGYLSEINFIDGLALTPSSFGEISPVTGQWQAKKYAGTYGTNGFYLPFTDNSAATATAIGADKSGNGNNWTPNNISLTAGASYDSMLDVPLGAGGSAGNGLGNYAVLNPILQNAWWAGPNRGSISNGNLTLSQNNGTAFSTFDVSTTGKWYLEGTVTSYGQATNASQFIVSARARSTYEISYLATGQKQVNGVNSAYGSSWTTGDVIGIAIDPANNQVTFYKNNVSQGAVSNTFPSETVLVGYYAEASGTDTLNFNFGQRPWAYTPPTGFKALHTGNLPDPVIKLPAQYMAATTYTGNGATQAITGMGFAPDLVWTKARSSVISHGLFDTVRGAGKAVFSNVTNAEFDYGTTTAGELYQFTSDGFNLGSSGNFNANGVTYVGWQWKANGAAVANNAGSITSQVSAGVAQGFSVVTYTGTGANATVGHGLGVAPKIMFYKARSTTSDWLVLNRISGSMQYGYLNQTAAFGTAGQALPTSTVMSLGGGAPENASGQTYVAYCFSEVAGYSKFGSYVGNGSADGPFVYCGFRPRYVMGKSTSAVGEWRIFDTARDSFNAAQSELFANLSNAETTNVAYSTDILSNGFKPRNTNTGLNDAGVTYIFMAFAEAPFKNSLAR